MWKSERHVMSPTCWFTPQILQEAGLDQAEARSLQLSLVSCVGVRDPRTWNLLPAASGSTIVESAIGYGAGAQILVLPHNMWVSQVTSSLPHKHLMFKIEGHSCIKHLKMTFLDKHLDILQVTLADLFQLFFLKLLFWIYKSYIYICILCTPF